MLPKRMHENKDVRTAVKKLEHAIRDHAPLLDLEPVHHFAKGVYARELFMPAGSIVTSKIHKTEHFAVIVKGRVTVVQEDGKVEISAPYMTVTKPGTKRALYVHEDTIWITFHPTEKTDVEEIEHDIIADDFDDTELLEMQEEDAQCLGLQSPR